MSSHTAWLEDAKNNGWEMPRAAWWKRLPVIRRVRAVYHAWHVNRHQRMWTEATGALHSGYDRWVIYGIATGMERPIIDREGEG